jgi:hypothetical protein
MAACSDGTGPASGPGLHLQSAASAVDTIGALVREPLAVIVRDDRGNPAAHEVVSFFVASSGSVGVASEGGATFLDRVVDTTDARGRAAVRVRLGFVAGAAKVVIRVSSLGFVDTARYTVIPGAAAHLGIAPHDTTVYVGARYTLRATVTDRAGNLRAGDVATSFAALGPASVDAVTGVVSTQDLGRAAISARFGKFVDTAWVSVPPHAWVAAQQHIPGNGGPIGVFLMQLDGSGKTALAAGLDNAYVSGQGFGWSPDGQTLAIARGDSVDLVSPGSRERRITGGRGEVLLGARFSRDGQWIYFARANTGIFRVHPDGTGDEHLGFGGTDSRPSPSPDGRSVAYGSDRSPCGVDECVRVLDIDTGQERILIGGDISGVNTAWSPTSDVVAYAFRNEVGLIHADGTGRQVLATDAGHVGWLDWSSDGRWLLASPGVGPVLLFDTTNGTRMPLATLTGYGATAWRPDVVTPSGR